MDKEIISIEKREWPEKCLQLVVILHLLKALFWGSEFFVTFQMIFGEWWPLGLLLVSARSLMPAALNIYLAWALRKRLSLARWIAIFLALYDSIRLLPISPIIALTIGGILLLPPVAKLFTQPKMSPNS